MTPRDSTCILHRGDGVVGIGHIARFAPDSMLAADVWWEEFCADLENETELPGVYGTGPVAFGSFVFDPDRTSARSVMIVPRTIVGRRYGISWITQLSYGDVDDDPPMRQMLPARPHIDDIHPGTIDDDRWLQLARQAQELFFSGGIEQLIIMRDLLVGCTAPIDPRWPVALLTKLFPQSWTYLVSGTIGTTSKLLAQVRDDLITSRALTHAPRRHDSTECHILDALTGQGPIAAEHAQTVESVRRTLASFSKSWHRPQHPGIVTAPDGNYLASDITGVADGSASSLSVAANIHPTAFVTGTSADRARAVLSEAEEVDRGRVSGPVGWIDTMGNGQWLSDTRGGQIDATDPSRIHLFTGIPISSSTTPEDMAEDLRTRVRVLMDVLNAH